MSLNALPASPDSAKRLLGATITCGSVSGRVVETEFYDQTDPASHTFNGVTPRNRPMFERSGHLYVYRSYGIHWCANIVIGPVGVGSAVLLRALEPLTGIDHMRLRRPKAKTERDLCSGPGKLCAALGISGQNSGLDLTTDKSPVLLELADPLPNSQVAVGVRVGISKAVEQPWRFAVRNSSFVSKPGLTLGFSAQPGS